MGPVGGAKRVVDIVAVGRRPAAKSGSLAFSPGWKRRFSSRSSEPGSASAAAESRQSGTKITLRPRACPSTAATGEREYAGSGTPLALPRWEHAATTSTRSSSQRRVGRAATMRVSSMTLPSATGTLRSRRANTRAPSRSSRSPRAGRVTRSPDPPCIREDRRSAARRRSRCRTSPRPGRSPERSARSAADPLPSSGSHR